MFGLDFLVQVHEWMGGKVGQEVLVTGGGNVAMDVAMSAKRLGAKRVVLACLESEGEMPAGAEEVARAREEGIEITVGLGGKNDIKGTKRLPPWAYTSPRQDVLAICQLIAFWETALTVANEERGKEKPVAYPGPFGALALISVLRCAGMHGIG